MRHMQSTLVSLARALAVLVLFGAAASAQDIIARLSVKYVLDANGNRPTGYYGDPNNLIATIGDANGAMERYGRGYWFEVVQVFDVAGHSEYYDVADEAEYAQLASQSQSDPDFAWDPFAVNVYVVNSAFAAKGGNPVLMISTSTIHINWLHELGHHFGLAHTFDPDDFVPDTVPEPNVNQCTSPLGCPLGGTDECCCTTKESNLQLAAQQNGWTQQQVDDIRYNAMSYFGALDCSPQLTFDNLRLTPGQMDRWTDGTQALANEVSGLTWFVDAAATSPYTGLSSAPFRTVADALLAADPAGGDVVLLLPGAYPETLTLDEPLVLRARSGKAVIGP